MTDIPPAPTDDRSRPRRLLPRVLLIASGTLLALLLLLLFAAPAGLAARIAASAGSDVRLFAASGRLLDGSADLLVREHHLGRLAWRVRPLALLQARLEVELGLQAPGHAGSAQLSLASSGAVEIHGLQALIRERTLDQALRPYDIEPTGTLEISDGRLTASSVTGPADSADGDGHWSGGVIRYRLGGRTFSAAFPPLDARLRMREGGPVLVVTDARGAELLDATLRADGWADLRVRYRLVELAGYPWPDAPAPDVIVVEISEQVL